MKVKTLSWATLLGLAAFVWTGCEAQKKNLSDRNTKILATTAFVEDFARQVVGKTPGFEIESLMGSGVDPHLYRATARDLEKISDADLIVYHGLHLEGRMTEVFDQLRVQKRAALALAEQLPKEQLLVAAQSSVGEKTYDPHVWMDVGLWAQAIAPLTEALVKLRPEHGVEFRANAKRYKEELMGTEKWIREQINALPIVRRVLVTSHDAFGYFGRAYGVKVLALQGISTSTEVSLRTMMDLALALRQSGVKVLFVESSVSPKALEKLSLETGARIGGELYSDALGLKGQQREGFDVGSYQGMIRYNVHTFKQAIEKSP